MVQETPSWFPYGRDVAAERCLVSDGRSTRLIFFFPSFLDKGGGASVNVQRTHPSRSSKWARRAVNMFGPSGVSSSPSMEQCIEVSEDR